MRYLRLTLVFTMIMTGLLLIAPPAQAQGGTISYGDSVTGYVVNGGIDVWSFWGTGGEVISVTMYADAITGSTLDPYVWLYDSNGNEVMFNDDYYGLDAAIMNFTIPYDDMFTVQASGYGEGSYTLNLTLEQTAPVPGGPGPGPAPQGGGLTAYGNVEGGYISNGSIDIWTFYGTAGDVISITMYADGASSLDTVLTLRDGTDTWHADNDDYYGLDAAILNYALPFDETYHIYATGYGEGGYTLYLTLEAQGAGPGVPPIQQGPEALMYGDTVAGSLTASTLQWYYSFQGAQGDQVTITMNATDAGLDPFLTLQNPNYQDLLSDDDGFGNLDSQIDFTLPADGIYIIVAASVGGSTGSYTLSLQGSTVGVPPVGPAGTPAGGMINYGETKSNVCCAGDQPADFHWWQFDAQAGDIITVTMESLDAGMAPYLVILSGGGRDLAWNNNAQGSATVTLVFAVPSASRYMIGPMARVGRGSYTLTLMKTGTSAASTGGTLQYNQTVVDDVSANNDTDVWTFQAATGDIIAISMSALDFTMDPFLSLYGPGNQPMVDMDDIDYPNNTNALVHFTVNQTGAYSIRATSSSASARGSYTLTLSLRGVNYTVPGGVGPRFHNFTDIGNNTVMSGQITDCGNPDTWRINFIPSPGYTLNIFVEWRGNVGFDPVVRLYEVDSLVAENDEGEGMAQDAWIKNYEVQNAVEHYIQVSCADATAGQYEIRVEPILILSP